MGAESPTRKVSPRVVVLLVVVALIVLGVDQLAKYLVVSNLQLDKVVPIVGDLLQFRYVTNSGAAFSIGNAYTWIFSILAAGVTIVIIAFAPRIRSKAWAVVFGLLLGGVLGNLIDRLFREPGFGVGWVVDFITIPLLPAIFNLADVAITASMVMLLILTVLGVNLDGTRGSRGGSGRTPEPAGTDAPSEDPSARDR